MVGSSHRIDKGFRNSVAKEGLCSYRCPTILRKFRPNPEQEHKVNIRGRAPKAQGEGVQFFFSRGGLILKIRD